MNAGRFLRPFACCFLGFSAAGNAVDQLPEGTIGVMVTKHNGVGLVIGDVLLNGPADKRKVKPGFVITRVDGRSLANMPIGNAKALLRGEPGSVARVELANPKDFDDTTEVLIPREKSRFPPPLLAAERAAIARGGFVWSIPNEGDEPVAQF